jgi:cysteinyl-tRNA synthetase
MADILALIERLMAKGLAYRVNGDVYFSVERYPDYGRLSKRRLAELQAGARVEVDERKRHPMDFALWKSSKVGEPWWESPWGAGRPGWHIECSAMSMRHLGATFDIHGGGMDLVFPHHENEMAQSCGSTGMEFARYWVHNGFVQINQEKMSKSLGNFFTVREIFEKSDWPEEVTGEILRYFLLATHYRSPLEFSSQSLAEAKNALNGFYDLFHRLSEADGTREVGDKSLEEVIEQARPGFSHAMDDDLNTPVALTELQKLRNEVNKLVTGGLSVEGRRAARQEFRRLGDVLGLFQLERWQFKPAFKGNVGGNLTMAGVSSTVFTDDEIQKQIEARNEARRRRDFKKGDEIRQLLASQGITIEDRPDGTSRWKR